MSRALVFLDAIRSFFVRAWHAAELQSILVTVKRQIGATRRREADSRAGLVM